MKLPLMALVALQICVPSGYSQTGADPYKNSTNLPPSSKEDGISVLSLEELVISLPLEDAYRLLRDQQSDAERFKEATAQIDSGKAKVERLNVIRVKPDQRAVTESVVEFRYPTEYTKAEPKDEKKEQAGKASASLIYPTAFETRNVGDTLELQVQLSADGTIDLEIIPSRVRFLSDRSMGVEGILQPIFQNQKLVTKVTLILNRPFLLGTRNPPFDPGYGEPNEPRVWLDFITISSVENASEAKAPEAGAQPPGTPKEAGYVTVTGEVKTPRRVPYKEGLSLLDAIQAAGGFTDFASRKNVLWTSKGKKRAVVDTKIIMSDPGQDIRLSPGDEITVQSSAY